MTRDQMYALINLKTSLREYWDGTTSERSD